MEEQDSLGPGPRRVARWWSGAWLAGGIVVAFSAAAWASRILESLSVMGWTRGILNLLILMLPIACLLAGFATLLRFVPVRRLWMNLGWAALGLALVYGLGIPWRYGFNERRVLEMLVTRFDPLVHAIERFNGERGRPPQALEELVPEFLAEIPEADVLDQRVRPEYHWQAPWSLRVDLRLGSWIGYPTGELDYRPDQHYDDEPWRPGSRPRLEDGRYRNWHWRIVWW